MNNPLELVIIVECDHNSVLPQQLLRLAFIGFLSHHRNAQLIKKNPHWTEWKEQGFRKVVRRAKSKEFRKLSKEDQNLTISGISPQCLLFSGPNHREDESKNLLRAQASGFNFSDKEPKISDFQEFAVVVNKGLGLSAGKSLAAVCHVSQLSQEQGIKVIPEDTFFGIRSFDGFNS